MNYLPSEKKMSIAELAEVFNCGESTIKRAIEKHYPGLMKNGVKTYLDETQVTVIKLEISKHHNLSSSGQLPQTELEKEMIILQAMQFQNEKIQKLESKVQEMLPKAEFYDQVTGSKDTIDMGQAAKVLKLNCGRNRLFLKLRNAKVLRVNNEPYQSYIDAGYFKLIESKYTVGDITHISLKTVVTQKGLDFILKNFGE